MALVGFDDAVPPSRSQDQDAPATIKDVSADGLVSLSNVPVTTTPLFNDESLIIYNIDRLFNTASFCSFMEVIKVLRSHRCSLMASFLEMESTSCGSALTVFAPVDQVLVNRFGDLSLFCRHVALGYLSWSDLKQGTVLMTKLQGFTIEVSRYDGVLVLNGATVLMPKIFRSDWLVVHAIGDVLDLHPNGVGGILVHIGLCPDLYGESYLSPTEYDWGFADPLCFQTTGRPPVVGGATIDQGSPDAGGASLADECWRTTDGSDCEAGEAKVKIQLELRPRFTVLSVNFR
ncbi:hypothetical protein ACLB2K_036409 [Fragaria x ananassa]